MSVEAGCPVSVFFGWDGGVSSELEGVEFLVLPVWDDMFLFFSSDVFYGVSLAS